MASLPLTPGIPLPFDNLRAQALGPTCAGALGGRLLVGIAVLVLVGVPETFALITGPSSPCSSDLPPAVAAAAYLIDRRRRGKGARRWRPKKGPWTTGAWV